MSHPSFDLGGRIAVITGGAGLLGRRHAAAIATAGGIPVLWDLCELNAEEIRSAYGPRARGMRVDITDPHSVERAAQELSLTCGGIDILINNAANNPKVEHNAPGAFSRLEHFPLTQWDADLNVGLKGAFLCARAIGTRMADRGAGVIVNIASDLAVIAPDQRLYHQAGIPADSQAVKPITYSVVKTGLIGLTRYLATYWCDRGVRCNALSPGGIRNGQPEEFVTRVSSLIPLQRMARVDEYEGALVFLCSDASSYMTGHNLVIDGGRSCW